MKMEMLLENRSISDKYINKHGLSIYIEIDNQKILFDTGVDDSFAINAEKMNVNLSDVDLLILSHGHYDHGGGLNKFLELNKKANIYVSENAFQESYKYGDNGDKIYIGIDLSLENNPRFIKINRYLKISNNLEIFGGVHGEKYLPKSNSKLLKLDGENLIPDDFEHEVNLIIHDKGQHYLICGCAHKGIVNIVEEAEIVSKESMDIVVGGMHLNWFDKFSKEDCEFLDGLINELKGFDVKSYYTGHCTGEDAFEYIHKKMRNIYDIKTGMTIEI